jgi:hypothetical protein
MSSTTTDQYMQETCRYCDSKLPDAFLDLGLSPLANSLVRKEDQGNEEFKCPLKLVQCPTCDLVQLSHVVPAEMMFANYLYVSSTTKTFQEHFANYAKSVKAKLLKDKDPLAVDIGSNDGLLLSCYQNEGMRAVGIDPASNLAKTANENGRPTINDYFGESSVQKS